MIGKKIKKERGGKQSLRSSGKILTKYNYSMWILIWSRFKQNLEIHIHTSLTHTYTHTHTHTHTPHNEKLKGGKLELCIFDGTKKKYFRCVIGIQLMHETL